MGILIKISNSFSVNNDLIVPVSQVSHSVHDTDGSADSNDMDFGDPLLLEHFIQVRVVESTVAGFTDNDIFARHRKLIDNLATFRARHAMSGKHPEFQIIRIMGVTDKDHSVSAVMEFVDFFFNERDDLAGGLAAIKCAILMKEIVQHIDDKEGFHYSLLSVDLIGKHPFFPGHDHFLLKENEWHGGLPVRGPILKKMSQSEKKMFTFHDELL